jgi:ribose 5-phosphate isomerase RpiB
MIYTQRQLESLLKIHGQIVLPYRARLSPLAQDWVQSKKIAIGYSDSDSSAISHSSKPASIAEPTPAVSMTGGFGWWCDGPCGPSKAAIISLEREANLRMLDIPQHESNTVQAIKTIAQKLKTKEISGAIVMVKTGAAAVVYANRCPSIRAILGTCIDAVDQGLRLVGANVLVIEHPYKSLSQTKTLATRFVKSVRTLGEDTKRDLAELSTCA